MICQYAQIIYALKEVLTFRRESLFGMSLLQVSYDQAS